MISPTHNILNLGSRRAFRYTRLGPAVFLLVVRVLPLSAATHQQKHQPLLHQGDAPISAAPLHKANHPV